MDPRLVVVIDTEEDWFEDWSGTIAGHLGDLQRSLGKAEALTRQIDPSTGCQRGKEALSQAALDRVGATAVAWRDTFDGLSDALVRTEAGTEAQAIATALRDRSIAYNAAVSADLEDFRAACVD